MQEMYSKGMILASAIRQVRGLGDNKFEVVTSLRTFIFRAEREGRQSGWKLFRLTLAPPACSSQKPSDGLSYPSSTKQARTLELSSYKAECWCPWQE
ncbi:arf-GAP with Rho-GAP domain, ANK repeat and PH domain-containing protein 2 [Lates japonicus]|uniref:Arf-GAP with Rho-GAP domain, ANK repeat and PH domain-containing protein 2 n=1 Tax=Lates japonicus TaxID=270547 RepID=A0AAD3RNP9_LATJO|nr:arf-GAP with Rho-GAP domain, ANK repeat and PH domain-containing protein 2 [Lates japonicus]